MIGRLGDTKGRKTALVLTIFLMAFGTVAIGLLPSYEAIGVWARILLVCMRVVQDFAAGGEWGPRPLHGRMGAAKPRGLLGSFQQLSTAGGTLLGSAVAAIMTSSLSQATMLDWGWRVPFLFGVLLLFVGAYLRQNVDETPSYQASRQAAADQPVVAGFPLGRALRLHHLLDHRLLRAARLDAELHPAPCGLTPSQALS